MNFGQDTYLATSKNVITDDGFLDPEYYGSCEGEDAMYVKLISSDGHEFIIKRYNAMTSGTIKVKSNSDFPGASLARVRLHPQKFDSRSGAPLFRDVKERFFMRNQPL